MNVIVPVPPELIPCRLELSELAAIVLPAFAVLGADIEVVVALETTVERHP